MTDPMTTEGVALVVERDVEVAARIAEAIGELGYGTVHTVSAMAHAPVGLGSLALVVVGLERETPEWQTLIEQVASLPAAPQVVVASATATRAQVAWAFARGMGGYVDKPVAVDGLRAALRASTRRTSALRQGRDAARAMVGHLGLKDALSLVRDTMVDHALCCAGDSRRAAAKMLGVDRRVVQRCVAVDEVEPAAAADVPAAVVVPTRVEPTAPRREPTTGVHAVRQVRRRPPSARIGRESKAAG